MPLGKCGGAGHLVEVWFCGWKAGVLAARGAEKGKRTVHQEKLSGNEVNSSFPVLAGFSLLPRAGL